VAPPGLGTLLEMPYRLSGNDDDDEHNDDDGANVSNKAKNRFSSF
jgi:hypothetical protein